MREDSNRCLRSLCRSYLLRLRYLAKKNGLGGWIEGAIKDTSNPDCKPTEHEVELLSRAVNDERLRKDEVPAYLGKNSKTCFYDGDYDRIKKLPRQGIYSKVSTLLYASKKK